MQFMLRASISTFDFSQGDLADATWGSSGEFRIVFTSRPDERTDDPRGFVGYGLITRNYSVSEEIHDFLQKIRDDPTSNRNFSGPHLFGEDAPDGSVHQFFSGSVGPWYTFPLNIARQINEIYVNLSDALSEAIDLLRWRSGDNTSPRAAFAPTFDLLWSDGNDQWFSVFFASSINFSFSRDLPFPFDAEDLLREAREQDFRSPLAHDLLREAYGNRFDNPRSAVVLLIAAAEIAIKQCISELVPNSAYLIEKQPAPPVDELLKHYLHTLPVRRLKDGRVPRVPGEIRKKISEGVQLRNKIVHRPSDGRVAIKGLTREDLYLLFAAVSDLLWLIDFYLGHEFAVQYIRPSTWNTIKAEAKES